METRTRPGKEDRKGTVKSDRKKREKVTRSKTKKEQGATERDLETCHHLLKVIA